MNTAKTLSVIALIVAFVALIMAWMAYNRTGVDFEEVIQREVSESMVEINADLQELEEAARENAAEQLRESAEEVDEDTATTTEAE